MTRFHGPRRNMWRITRLVTAERYQIEMRALAYMWQFECVHSLCDYLRRIDGYDRSR